ncbi:ADP-ribosylglycohydrolase family protein [Schaalia sp. ZJ405]|uniref:ADP-ribosylglycohydrolase family protein n=1 Tax=Schaalia sp. ZJ405 TaxID=2709403 RepID=UPI0013EB56D2|nr:ADP-ribosylglycohydrolase family protein [Schaalia sp. ZJ405]QPK80928.1 ADP-ribosylglycohydrolase family protein [Schaalia sp. ZJ405]
MRITWAQPEDLVAHELVALGDEGIVPENIINAWRDAGGSLIAQVSGASPIGADCHLRELARTILHELDTLDNPARIEAVFDAPDFKDGVKLRENQWDTYMVRVRGAWYGRLVGCVSGKPVEKIPRQGIRAIAQATGNWPIHGYFTQEGLPGDIAERWPWNRRSRVNSLVENINGTPEDDDINYPLLALELLETKGPEFTSDDVAQLWLDNLPAGRVFTAERAAYRNLLDARPVPECGHRLNPFREWIGALIRADVFGWTNPGKPHRAAYLAWKDARISHSRNGIYGEMWAAALCSAAMSESTISEALDVSLTVISSTSALHEAVTFGRECAASTTDCEAGLDALHDRYGHHHWVHVLNNAATIAFALEFSGGDFWKGIHAGVAAGWDTDSVGATIGGVIGAFCGLNGIGDEYTAPLNNSIATSLPGKNGCSIDDVIARTVALARANND